MQQIALSRFGLHDYVLNAPRTSLVSANKEGLVSLLGKQLTFLSFFLSLCSWFITLTTCLKPTLTHESVSVGYLSIQLLGLSIGTLILPPTPSFFSRRQKYLLQHGSSTNATLKKRRNSDPDPVDSDEEKEKEKDTEFDLGAPRELDKTATELCAYAILWWTLLGFIRLSGLDVGGVSRRMV